MAFCSVTPRTWPSMIPSVEAVSQQTTALDWWVPLLRRGWSPVCEQTCHYSWEQAFMSFFSFFSVVFWLFFGFRCWHSWAFSKWSVQIRLLFLTRFETGNIWHFLTLLLSLQADSCEIGGQCFETDEVNPLDECQQCRPLVDRFQLFTTYGENCLQAFALQQGLLTDWLQPQTSLRGGGPLHLRPRHLPRNKMF